MLGNNLYPDQFRPEGEEGHAKQSPKNSQRARWYRESLKGITSFSLLAWDSICG